MSELDSIVIPSDIAQFTGPVLLGHLFNWGLFGTLSLQVYLYYLSFPKDKALPKIVVSVFYIVEIVQTVLATRDAFRDFGPGWGDVTVLNEVGWIWFSVPVLSSLISCAAQIFYARRIYMLSKKAWVPIIVIILSLVQAGAGIYGGASAHELGEFSEVPHRTYKQTIVWLGGTAICDIIIATSMMYYLAVSRTGFRATNLLIAKFIRITIETGLICATFAVLDLALFLGFPNTNFHLAPAIALSKLYSNSLLTVLNARMQIVGGRGVSPYDHDSLISSGNADFSNRMLPRAPMVNVTIVRDEISDGVDSGMKGRGKTSIDF